MRTLDLLDRRIRVAIATAGHQRSAVVLLVDHVDALKVQHTRIGRRFVAAEFLSCRFIAILRVVGPALLDLSDLPQFTGLVERIGIEYFAGLAVHVDELGGIGVTFTPGIHTQHVDFAERLIVIRGPAVGTVIHGLGIARTCDRENAGRADIFPAMLHRAAVEPVEILQGMVRAEQRVRLHLH